MYVYMIIYDYTQIAGDVSTTSRCIHCVAPFCVCARVRRGVWGCWWGRWGRRVRDTTYGTNYYYVAYEIVQRYYSTAHVVTHVHARGVPNHSSSTIVLLLRLLPSSIHY